VGFRLQTFWQRPDNLSSASQINVLNTLMLYREVKQGDQLILRHSQSEIASVKVVGVLSMHGERIIVASINGEPPVHIDEDLLLEQCEFAEIAVTPILR
jgi:hypothetical protein